MKTTRGNRAKAARLLATTERIINYKVHKYGIDSEYLEYHQSLIQLVRAGASQGIAAFMSDVEVTDEWLFERQRFREEAKFRDPDDIYISVREREKARENQGLPRRIQFLDQELGEANVKGADSSSSGDE